MKYMIMMFNGLCDSLPDRSPEWIAGMHELLMGLDKELRENGELVAGDSLIDPARARTVRVRGGVPVATDGPYAEIKESLAGYWIVEVTEERALEVASRVAAYTGEPMEVRQLMDTSSQP
jgi:hypothetical protein